MISATYVLSALLFSAVRHGISSSAGSVFLVLPNVAAIAAFELSSDTTAPL